MLNIKYLYSIAGTIQQKVPRLFMLNTVATEVSRYKQHL